MKNSLFLLALLFTAGFTGCATIDPGERGVRVELGKVDSKLVQPGITNINPFTTEIHEYTIKQGTVEGHATPLTADQQPIEIGYKVLYRIPESQLLNLYQNYQGDPFATLVSPQIQEAFRQVVSQSKADAVIANVNSVKSKVLAQVQSSVNGLVDVVDIPITHVELPSELKQAILDKQKMEIESKQKSFELDKEMKQAQITVTKAKAEAEATKLKANAIAKSPELIKYKLAEAEVIKANKWNGQLPTTVAGGALPLFNMK